MNGMLVEEIVARLGLERLDHEGGWFRRIHTGEKRSEGRACCTTIYALFTREEFSALHRLDAVEQFFFLDGDAFEVFRIGSEVEGRWETLGRDFEKGESPHLVFDPGEWFGGVPVAGGKCGWTLMSCVVTPGFEWEGFEVGRRDDLLAVYPKYGDSIRLLTR
ncbi:cupin domain-containing protein [Pelagicoccus sp. SDUM812005]|uniref:cupin domain-containing protein n=1 Tax=Pelagicoccus sp. SDUM812005 TaxID=3041257 RepID=UPI00280EA409|nr:cupin domain-containing protein [Pelagicoccus sp. SDUM812005]MDQ8182973.1 cupin domain-containing protein [Pelagicoccus sp. SDUM812005]